MADSAVSRSWCANEELNAFPGILWNLVIPGPKFLEKRGL